MQSALLISAWVLIAATLLPFIKHEKWWIRLLDFPRTQITIAGLLCLAGLLAWHRDRPFDLATIAVLAITTAYQTVELARYTPLRRVQSLPHKSSETERRLSLLVGNVLMTNRSSQDYIGLVREHKPDLVVLAEPDTWWEREMRVIESEYPYTMKCPIENTYGMLLYSRLPLSETQIRFMVQEDIPSFHCFITLRTGDMVELHCIHPRPPHIGIDTTHRDAELIVLAKEIQNSPNPIIVTGDLNDVAWSHTTRLFLRLSKLLDPRVGRKFCNTFNANYWFLRWPLDHLFHSRAFRLVRLERLPKSGSDHFPVLVELSFEPEIRHEQERPTEEATDRSEAREKLQNVGKA